MTINIIVIRNHITRKTRKSILLKVIVSKLQNIIKYSVQEIKKIIMMIMIMVITINMMMKLIRITQNLTIIKKIIKIKYI